MDHIIIKAHESIINILDYLVLFNCCSDKRDFLIIVREKIKKSIYCFQLLPNDFNKYVLWNYILDIDENVFNIINNLIKNDIMNIYSNLINIHEIFIKVYKCCRQNLFSSPLEDGRSSCGKNIKYIPLKPIEEKLKIIILPSNKPKLMLPLKAILNPTLDEPRIKRNKNNLGISDFKLEEYDLICKSLLKYLKNRTKIENNQVKYKQKILNYKSNLKPSNNNNDTKLMIKKSFSMSSLDI